jgi:hypothetical protein
MDFRYRSKPVEIEAFRMLNNSLPEREYLPQWAWDACIANKIYRRSDVWHIKSLIGPVQVYPNGYIVRDAEGNLATYSPFDFEEKYEKI